MPWGLNDQPRNMQGIFNVQAKFKFLAYSMKLETEKKKENEAVISYFVLLRSTSNVKEFESSFPDYTF
jgi:hypothetical protein